MIRSLLCSTLCVATLIPASVYIPQRAISPIDPLGLYTNITLKLDERTDNQVSATAKNTFTLLPSTIPITIWLYFSNTYTTDYNQMVCCAIEQDDDIDQGETLTAVYRTSGVSKYWRATAEYIFNGIRYNIETPTYLFDGTGQRLT